MRWVDAVLLLVRVRFVVLPFAEVLLFMPVFTLLTRSLDVFYETHT